MLCDNDPQFLNTRFARAKWFKKINNNLQSLKHETYKSGVV